MAITTINLEEETKDRLKAKGRFGESYEQLLSRVLDEHDHSYGKNTQE